MKFENTIMNTISNIIAYNDHHNRNVELSPLDVDFIEKAEGFSIETSVSGYWENYDTELTMSDISKLELGREYNAAEIFAQFDGSVELDKIIRSIYTANYLRIDAVKKIHENDDIVVILVSNLSWDSIYIRRDFDKYEVSNHYYVINKRGE